jgi:hypothetical protein
MNLMEMLQKFLDEQGWREKKAQQYSSGLGSLPYSFEENMDMRYPLLMNQLDKDKKYNQQYQSKQIEGQPDWFMERLLLNEMMKTQKQNKESLMKQML